MSDSFTTPWTIGPQDPQSMGFFRQKHWSRLPFPSPGDLPDPVIESLSPTLAGRFFTTEPHYSCWPQIVILYWFWKKQNKKTLFWRNTWKSTYFRSTFSLKPFRHSIVLSIKPKSFNKAYKTLPGLPLSTLKLYSLPTYHSSFCFQLLHHIYECAIFSSTSELWHIMFFFFKCSLCLFDWPFKAHFNVTSLRNLSYYVPCFMNLTTPYSS